MSRARRAWRNSRLLRLFIVASLFTAATQLVLSRESGLIHKEGPQSKAIGSDRLVSMEKLPDMGEYCETPIANTAAGHEQVLMAALEQRQEGRASSLAARAAGPAGVDTQDRSKMKPIRWIRDPYAAFSSIAVDPINNEVVM